MSKLLIDDLGRPIPQYQNPEGTFEALQGGNGAMKVGIDSTNNEVVVSNNIKIDSLPSLPEGDNTVGKVGIDSNNNVVQITGNITTIPLSESIVLLSSAQKVESGNTIPVDVSKYRKATFFLDVTEVDGIDATLDISIKTKDLASGKWFNIGEFEQVTEVQSKIITLDMLAENIAVFYTISGDTPSFTFSVGAIFKS